jgi:hypothetical protein
MARNCGLVCCALPARAVSYRHHLPCRRRGVFLGSPRDLVHTGCRSPTASYHRPRHRYPIPRCRFGCAWFYVRMSDAVILESTITCPNCGSAKAEIMPTDACQFFYECTGCGALFPPKLEREMVRSSCRAPTGGIAALLRTVRRSGGYSATPNSARCWS